MTEAPARQATTGEATSVLAVGLASSPNTGSDRYRRRRAGDHPVGGGRARELLTGGNRTVPRSRVVLNRRRRSTLAAVAIVVVLAGDLAWHPPSAHAALATPTLTLTAPVSGMAVGIGLSAEALLSLGSSPTGRITFRVFSPADPACAGTPDFTWDTTVNGNGRYVSGLFYSVVAGTYRWTATYSGDAANAPSATPCAGTAGTVVVVQILPIITPSATVSSAPATTTASAVLTGAGPNGPTGTLTFSAYGPDNLLCIGSAFFSSVKTVTGNRTYASDPIAPAKGGIYRWVVTYGGDASNVATSSPCNAPGTVVSVPGSTPTRSVGLITTASSTTTVGRLIFANVNLMGTTIVPTGTVTFRLFGPSDPGCTSPLFTTTSAVTGTSINSAVFVTQASGTYRWTTSYSGDATYHAPPTTLCSASAAAVVVSKVRTTLRTTALAPASGTISATAALTGLEPTGTVTFFLNGPDDVFCAGPPIFQSTVAVNGAGTYQSAGFRPTRSGTYRWRASYGGDARNLGSSITACLTTAASVNLP